MNASLSIPRKLTSSPATALAWEICRENRLALLAVLAAIPICATVCLLLSGTQNAGRIFADICTLLMSLSLAVVFSLFKFTESDRKQRFTGFPSRLFTLPVRTWQLVLSPMLFGAAMVSLVYLGWAGLVFRSAYKPLPFGWPCLYLATGMVCFQAIVWALANFRITRLIVLGVFGSVLMFGWMLFSQDILTNLMPGVARDRLISMVNLQMGLLCALSFASYCAAWWAVERQRRGASFKFAWPQWGFLSRSSFSIAKPKRFPSPPAAQFWFEWRRNGILLPASVGVLLLLIFIPATLIRFFKGTPLPADLGLWILFWILVLPFALAFIIGQGFGKTDFWGKELGLPLFHAVRPITAEVWCAVKLKTAAWSAFSTWLLVLATTTLWLAACLDSQPLLSVCRNVLQSCPPQLVAGVVFLPGAAFLFILAILILFTWRLLAANIYLGVLGSKYPFNLSVCCLFVTVLAGPGLGMWCLQHPAQFERLLLEPVWLPWALAICCAVKLGLAAKLWVIARRRGLVSSGTGMKYFAGWLLGTELLLLLVLLAPVSAPMSRLLALLAFLALPLVRASLAPLAFAQSRHN